MEPCGSFSRYLCGGQPCEEWEQKETLGSGPLTPMCMDTGVCNLPPSTDILQDSRRPLGLGQGVTGGRL
jgi:hypothetical protein